ncbi:hypothetical protein LIER_18340 [Lithospermum erythrorhizon]|uniref:Late embryogenesis abundant protein LEA-2 subgroup domain-containing protein n=1 Tax=Lithospermum erythrorhizon TaxID=34254 RepID=A0AAV3QDT8_LITER
MHTRTDLPTQATPGNNSFKRHHSARYYAHRVKESLTTRVSKLICAIFLALLFLTGLIFFILFLSLRPHRPRFHIHDFSIPASAQPTGFENAQINYNVDARNANQAIGIYYDTLEVTVKFEGQNVGGSSILFPFYQEPKNTTVLAGTLSGATLTVTNQSWQKFLDARSRGSVAFELDVTSSIRFKVSSWTSKRHRMHANCPVQVGSDGLILASDKDKRCSVYFS